MDDTGMCTLPSVWLESEFAGLPNRSMGKLE
jgi:hypothetical protein